MGKRAKLAAEVKVRNEARRMERSMTKRTKTRINVTDQLLVLTESRSRGLTT